MASLIELTVAAGPDVLSARRFVAREAISTLFSVEVWAVSPDDALDLEAIVGQAASLRVSLGQVFAPLGGARWWRGVCSFVEQVKAEPGGLSTYHLRVVPELWLLTQRTDHRVFQHMSVPDIVDDVLSRWGLQATWDVDRASHPKLHYKVQYGETDHDFVSRLLEEAGIAYTFPDPGGAGTTLTFGDSLHAAEARVSTPIAYSDRPDEARDTEHVRDLRVAFEVRPGAYAIRDFDHRNPLFPLLGEAEKAPSPEDRYEQYRYDPAAFLVEGGKGGDTPVGDDKGVARHELTAGANLARRSLEALRASRRLVSFGTNTVDLWPGVVFSVDGHPYEALGGARLLLNDLVVEGTPEKEWQIEGHAVFAEVPYRPPMKTKKPVASGVQSALVVGPTAQEIHTDELGRVRVQFPWDRAGKSDDDSSAWIRVSQGWAGTGFGLFTIPRVGHEVLVGFLEGDPDDPVIVGRVFNARNQVPYKLPDHKTRSTWKSQSSPAAAGFNELMFEDLAGKELVFLQAQKDMRTLVKNDEVVTVVNDRQKLVKGNETETTGGVRTQVVSGDRVEITVGDRTTVVGGSHAKLVKFNQNERTEKDSLLFVGKDRHVVVKGDRYEKVEKDSHLTVMGARAEQVDGANGLSAGSHEESVSGKYAVEAADVIHLKSGASLVIEAAAELTLKGPGGFLKIDGGGVTIVGNLVRINSGGAAGSASDAAPGKPTAPREATVVEPQKPVMDDVSKTGIGR